MVVSPDLKVAESKLADAVHGLTSRGMICKPPEIVTSDPPDDILGIRWKGGSGLLVVGGRLPPS